MTIRKLFSAATVAVGLTLMVAPASAAEPAPVKKPTFGFSTLKPLSAEVAKSKVAEWLAKVAPDYDKAAFDKIWADEKRSVLDRTADSLALGNTEAATILANIRKPDYIPAEVPALLKDEKLDPFFRTNVTLAFAKTAASKKVYEEALEALKSISPDHAVDPASYFFFRAVSEHATMKKDPAISSIVKLLDDVSDVPDRYKMVATLMFFDMQTWAADPKDLGNIERLMDNSGRRLDLARAGDKTQDIQKKIIFRLDEIIKELEAKNKGGGGQANGGSCPGGGQKPGDGPPGGNTTQPTQHAKDSVIMGGSGKGEIDPEQLKKIAEQWGTMPPAQRAKVVADLTRELPAKFEPMIKNYFEALDRVHGYKK